MGRQLAACAHYCPEPSVGQAAVALKGRGCGLRSWHGAGCPDTVFPHRGPTGPAPASGRVSGLTPADRRGEVAVLSASLGHWLVVSQGQGVGGFRNGVGLLYRFPLAAPRLAQEEPHDQESISPLASGDGGPGGAEGVSGLLWSGPTSAPWVSRDVLCRAGAEPWRHVGALGSLQLTVGPTTKGGPGRVVRSPRLRSPALDRELLRERIISSSWQLLLAYDGRGLDVDE